MVPGEVTANNGHRGADLVGHTLSHYRVTAAIGEGGMGEVYRATDSKLGRDVALKILPEAFSSDADRMARFQREAQVLASLNHPNIAAIYGLEEASGIRALVMELVEGTTLAERIERRQLLTPSSSGGPPSPQGRRAGGDGSGRAPLPLDESIHIAKQIADALEYAHEHGVIHRDLKPANVKVTPEGAVKVLDFGLAKAANDTVSSGDPSSSPTLTGLGTQVGMVMGTAAYMAPEQARGYAVDRRADIWSFGVVLFEMLSGQRPFAGESTSDILACVLKFEPDWSALPASTPPAIVRLLHRCLTKDRKQRLQAIGEARIALEETPSGAARAPAVAERPAPGELAAAASLPSLEVTRWRGRWAPWAAMAVVVAAAGLFALYRVMERPAPAARMQFAIPLQGDAVNLALSADGRMLALVERDDVSGEDMLYFERLGEPGATRLEETEGASYPFWSPDDSSIGFFADGKLQKIAIAGGGPQVLAAASRGRGGSWGKGVIIYAPDAGGPLWRVNADGAGAAALTDKVYLSGESSHRWPGFLPDGEHFLFWCGSFGSGPPGLKDGIYLSSLTAKEKKLVQPTEANANYTNGHLYYLDERKSLISVPFDPGDGKVTGDEQVVSDHVGYEPSVSYSAFAAGGDDTVVYSAGAGAIVLSTLVWYDRSGQELGRIGGPGLIANPSIAPDGNRVVVDMADLKTSNVDIWIEDLSHRAASRFTFDPTEEATPVWSRDGRMIAYRYNGVAAGIIDIKNASGLEPPGRFIPPGHKTISWRTHGLSTTRRSSALMNRRPAAPIWSW